MTANAALQNELVDKEVEQVIMKSSNQGNHSKKVGGYALPDDEDEDAGQPFHGNDDVDDEDEEQDDDGIGMDGQMDDEEEQMDDEEEDEEAMDDGGL